MHSDADTANPATAGSHLSRGESRHSPDSSASIISSALIALALDPSVGLSVRQMSPSLSPSVLALSATLAIGLLGCGTTPHPSAAPSPSATALTEPTAEEVTSALRFRTTFGLRADDPWIRAVFSDPASDRSFGVPLLPDEVAVVMNAQASANAIDGSRRGLRSDGPDGLGRDVRRSAGRRNCRRALQCERRRTSSGSAGAASRGSQDRGALGDVVGG